MYVAKVWGETTGATKAGIKIITDPLSVLAETLDFEFTVKGTGLLRRLQRFTAVIKNKKIEKLYFEKERGVCDNTSAEVLSQTPRSFSKYNFSIFLFLITAVNL